MVERCPSTIINQSHPYPNRGESKEHRVYLETDLEMDAPPNELKPL